MVMRMASPWSIVPPSVAQFASEVLGAALSFACLQPGYTVPHAQKDPPRPLPRRVL